MAVASPGLLLSLLQLLLFLDVALLELLRLLLVALFHLLFARLAGILLCQALMIPFLLLLQLLYLLRLLGIKLLLLLLVFLVQLGIARVGRSGHLVRRYLLGVSDGWPVGIVSGVCWRMCTWRLIAPASLSGGNNRRTAKRSRAWRSGDWGPALIARGT